jgi:hypothetical protein
MEGVEYMASSKNVKVNKKGHIINIKMNKGDKVIISFRS